MSKLILEKVNYSDLNSRQKENFNFQKISAVLAEYGFVTHRFTDDWQGADFIAQHLDGETFIKVQLKSRLTFERKYLGKSLYIAFRNEGDWYPYPHDEVLAKIVEETGTIKNTKSWKDRGGYSYPRLGQGSKEILKPYLLL